VSNTLTIERERLAETLRDALGIQAFAFLPEAFTPPAVVVIPGDPYITTLDEQTFHPAARRVQMEAWIIADTGTNERMAADLDQLAWDAAAALLGADFEVEEVEKPFVFTRADNAKFLATAIRVGFGANLTT